MTSADVKTRDGSPQEMVARADSLASFASESSCFPASFFGISSDEDLALGTSPTLSSAAWRQEEPNSASPQHDAGSREACAATASAVPAMFRQQMLLEQRLASEEQDRLSDSYSNPSAAAAGVRMIVVSWMVEVAEEYRLQQETLHMAVLLLDRFTALSEEVPRCVLQLLAVGCILLAAKELEVCVPTVEQLCCVTANHFQPPDLLRMERIILNQLDFRVWGPSSYTFLHLLAQACSTWLTPSVLSLAMYLCELAMLDSDTGSSSRSSSSSSLSHTAASALMLAQLTQGNPQHTPFIKIAIMHCTGVTTLHHLNAHMALLLRLQHVAYQHTLAALAAVTAHHGSSAPAAFPASTPPHAPPPSSASDANLAGEHQEHQAPPAGEADDGGDTSEDLLAPLRIKFGSGCWCNVSLQPPLALLPLQV